MAADPPSAYAGVLRAVAVMLLVLGSEVTRFAPLANECLDRRSIYPQRAVPRGSA